jgi:hypothetical protein
VAKCNGECVECGSCDEEICMTRYADGNYVCLVCLPPVYKAASTDEIPDGVIVDQVVS